jgi:endo-1,4-beta-D-glucanase Y
MQAKLFLRILRYLTCALIVSLSAPAHAASCDKAWPAWEAYKKNFIDAQGRVIDNSSEAMITTSEGQAYALFFALVANDRATFDKLLNWTALHQSKDDLTTHLPAWAWGKNDQGNWGRLDPNSAADADLWMAYTLGEAGRLWDNRGYVALSSLITDRILSAETLNVPGLGLVLLPGAVGFTQPSRVRLNPSYVPLTLLHWFVAHSKDARWAALLASSQQMLVKASPGGYAPDWILYDYNKGFLPDTEKGNMGSYDAIRVYLWAGMQNKEDPDRSTLLDTLKPMARLVEKQGYPPESINTLSGESHNQGPSGFTAAMIPFLQAQGMNKTAEQQLARIAAQPIENSYYNQVLGLYALGWHDNLYRFDTQGNLTLRWNSTCP